MMQLRDLLSSPTYNPFVSYRHRLVYDTVGEENDIATFTNYLKMICTEDPKELETFALHCSPSCRRDVLWWVMEGSTLKDVSSVLDTIHGATWKLRCAVVNLKRAVFNVQTIDYRF